MAISDQVKLDIYNGALRLLGSRELASLTENREPRRVLDGIWGTNDGVIQYALERGEWNFAIRTVQGVYSSDVTPTFGFRFAYDKPVDVVRLAAMSSDEYFTRALFNSEYMDETGYWFTDQPILYVRYVSNDAEYGKNSTLWTATFKDYLENYMASEACERLTNSTGKKDRLDRDARMALATAKSHDAMAEGVKMLPRGSWSQSRGWSRGGAIR